MDNDLRKFYNTMRLFYGQCNWSNKTRDKQLTILRKNYHTAQQREKLYIQINIRALLESK